MNSPPLRFQLERRSVDEQSEIEAL